jgi:DNA-directed RNA polymerase specialized sigma24 family protein
VITPEELEVYRAYALKIAWHYVREDAEDVVQAAFMYILSYTEPVRNLRAMVRWTVRKKGVDALKKKLRHARNDQLSVDLLPKSHTDVDLTMIADLQQLMDERGLTPRQQAALIRNVLGDTDSEAAETLGIHKKNYKSALYGARKRMNDSTR